MKFRISKKYIHTKAGDVNYYTTVVRNEYLSHAVYNSVTNELILYTKSEKKIVMRGSFCSTVQFNALNRPGKDVLIIIDSRDNRILYMKG